MARRPGGLLPYGRGLPRRGGPECVGGRGAAERPEGELDFDWPVVPHTDAQLNAPDPASRERLAEITAPTLVIGGGTTSHVDQKQLAHMADTIPDAVFVTIEAGHLVHTARPEEFLAALRSFGLG